MSKKSALVLFYSSLLSPVDDVGAALVSLGYVVTAEMTDAWMRRSGASDAGCFVLLADASTERWYQVLDGLTRRAAPILGVFAAATMPKQSLVARFGDFVIWPCATEELAQRLERIAPRLDATPELQTPDPCGHEFAHLNFLGRSPDFLTCVRLIKKLAECVAPVLIEGETGTGKELAAHALHYLGPRRGGPFIPVNCGALPDTLFENELFGHEKGAFTDARTAQKGLVAQAEGGTLFLDEVDTLSPKAQVALLRFLEDQQYRPLGGDRVKQGHVSLIAATNTSLADRTADGEFRQDLLYRLNVTTLPMPALRDRVEDILLLAEHFLRQFSARYQKPPKTLHPETQAWLLQRPWPGNVRELENVIHREFLLSDNRVILIDPAHYDERVTGDPAAGLTSLPFAGGFNQTRARVVRDFERRYLHWLMMNSHGNVSLAARRAGKERRSLGRLLQKHGVDRIDYLGAGPGGR